LGRIAVGLRRFGCYAGLRWSVIAAVEVLAIGLW